MGFVQILEALVQLLPIIHQVVLIVEKMFPNAASGAQKLDAAINMVMSFLPSLGMSTTQAAALQPIVTTAINAVVAAGNVPGAVLNPTPLPGTGNGAVGS